MNNAASAQQDLVSRNDELIVRMRQLQSMYGAGNCPPRTQEKVGTYSQVRVWIFPEPGNIINVCFRGTVTDFNDEPETCMANVNADANFPMRPLSAVAANWHGSRGDEVEGQCAVADAGVELGSANEEAGVEVAALGTEEEPQAHQGFLQAYMELDQFVINEVRSHASDMDAERLCVRVWGHSLGGAMATLAAMRLKTVEGIKIVEVFTFGSPRVGNEAFRKLYKDLGLHDTTMRFANVFDPVPYLPPTCAKDHFEGWSLAQDFATRISSSLNVDLHYVHVCEARPVDNASVFAARLPAFMAQLANMRSSASANGSISQGLLRAFLNQHSLELYCQNMQGSPGRAIVGSSTSALTEIAMNRFPIPCVVLQAIHLQAINPGQRPSIILSEPNRTVLQCPYCYRETRLTNPACLRVACDHSDCGKSFGTGVITKRVAGLYQTIAAVKIEGSLCATGLTSAALAAAQSETAAGTAARALAPLVARGAVQAAAMPSAVAAMIGGHIGQRMGHAAGGDRGRAIGEFSGNVGCGTAAGAVVAGAPGAAVGAGVAVVGWGISKGIRLVFPSAHSAEGEQEHRAIQAYLRNMYSRICTPPAILDAEHAEHEDDAVLADMPTLCNATIAAHGQAATVVRGQKPRAGIWLGPS